MKKIIIALGILMSSYSIAYSQIQSFSSTFWKWGFSTSPSYFAKPTTGGLGMDFVKFKNNMPNFYFGWRSNFGSGTEYGDDFELTTTHNSFEIRLGSGIKNSNVILYGLLGFVVQDKSGYDGYETDNIGTYTFQYPNWIDEQTYPINLGVGIETFITSKKNWHIGGSLSTNRLLSLNVGYLFGKRKKYGIN